MNVYLREVSKEYMNQKVLIFMDRAGWHTEKKLSIPPNNQIELLPPYSPELNPVEHLWQWLRRDS
jgi:transposase